MLRGIDLIYDPDCPHIEQARSELREALERLGLPPEWREWNRQASEAPGWTLSFGSPTVLVDGHDVVEERPDTHVARCRVYRRRDGTLQGTPGTAAILAALQGA
jgi:hypothetical protein